MPRRIGDYDEGWLERQTPAGLALKVIGALVALALVCGGISWGLGWIGTGAQVVSATNVKKQWQFAYDYNEDLRAAASQWCTLRRDELAAGAAGDREAFRQRGSQRIAVEQNYQRIKAEYDAALKDKFRAGVVAPPDVPRQAPTLTEKLTEIDCTATA